MKSASLPKWVQNFQSAYKNNRVGKDSFIIKAVIPLNSLRISPNLITAIGFICAMIAVYFLFNNHLLFVIFYLLNFMCDLFDGALARLSGKSNPIGKYLDAASDGVFGILILIKSYFHFKNLFILLPLILYLWDAKKMDNWAAGFYPNVTWLKIAYVFQLFTFGLIIQTLITIFNPIVRSLYGLKYNAKS